MVQYFFRRTQCDSCQASQSVRSAVVCRFAACVIVRVGRCYVRTPLKHRINGSSAISVIILGNQRHVSQSAACSLDYVGCVCITAVRVAEFSFKRHTRKAHTVRTRHGTTMKAHTHRARLRPSTFVARRCHYYVRRRAFDFERVYARRWT